MSKIKVDFLKLNKISFFLFFSSEEFIMLCTLNYHKDKPNSDTFINCLYCRSFQTRSTTTINNHHLFYPDQKRLLIYITKTRPTVTWSSPLFQQINDLFIETPIIPSSLWSNLWNMGRNHFFLL